MNNMNNCAYAVKKCSIVQDLYQQKYSHECYLWYTSPEVLQVLLSLSGVTRIRDKCEDQ